MAIGLDVVDQQAGKDPGAGNPISTVVDDGGDPHLGLHARVLLGESGTLPVIETAKAFIGGHAIDEREPTPLDTRLGIALQHPDIGNHMIGHGLEALIHRQVEGLTQAHHQGDVVGVFGIGEAFEDIGGQQACLQPSDLIHAGAHPFGLDSEDGGHLLLAGDYPGALRDELGDHLGDIHPGRALQVLMVGIGVGDGGEIVLDPGAL